MKPISITIEGIKSFYNKTEINFDFNGLFCICGDTGSGKTTILDCIILALYGKVKSGNNLADYINLRKDKGTVDLVFEATVDKTVQRYQVTRTISSNGTVSKAKLVNLTTGEVIAEQALKVNEELMAITELSVGDFTQVVVLQQGEFAKFLTSAKSDRSITVGNLFKLNKYRKLGPKISEKKNEAKIKLDANESALLEVESVTVDKIAEQEKELKRDKKSVTEVRNRVDELNAKVAALGKLKIEYDEAVAAKEELKKQKERAVMLEKALKDVKEKLVGEQANQQRIHDSITTVSEILGRLQGLKGLIDEAKAHGAKVTELRHAYVKVSDEYKKSVEEKEKAKVEYDESKKAYDESVALLKEHVASTGYKDKVYKIKNAYDMAKFEQSRFATDIDAEQKRLVDRTESSKNLLAAKLLAEEKMRVADEALASARQKEQENIMQKAAESLKNSLKEGDVCPVCGSVVDKIEHFTLQESDVAAKQKDYEDACRNASKAAIAAAGAAEQKSQSEKTLRELGLKFAAAEQLVNERLKEFPDVVVADKIIERIDTVMSLSNKLETLQEVVTAKTQNCELIKNNLDSIKEQGKVEANEQKRLEETVIAQAGGDAEKQIKKAEEQNAILIAQKEKSEKAINAYIEQSGIVNSDLAQTNSAIIRLESVKIPIYDAVEAENAAKELSNANELKETLIAACARRESEIAAMKGQHEKKMQLREEHAKLLSSYDVYSELYKLLSGEKFVNYIAEEYILGFTEQASAILMRVTNGKYELEYKDGDYYVTDFINGGSRKAVTLSGGETFLASLALAIAISREIARYKTYEFFFLDEGFGTLDERSLNLVTEALTTLSSDTMVGVVTHRSELTDRIFSKLEVEFSEEGSTVKRID